VLLDERQNSDSPFRFVSYSGGAAAGGYDFAHNKNIHALCRVNNMRHFMCGRI
jgi:hypothetical protein